MELTNFPNVESNFIKIDAMNDKGQENMQRLKFRNGIVSAKHPIAARAAIDIMKDGGNAIDAAVASAFVLGVVEPFNSGIGGGGSVLVKMGGNDEIVNIDYIPIASSRANERMFETEDGEAGAYAWPRVRGRMNEIGYASICVPGNMAGLSKVLDKYGNMELNRVMEPAVKVAENGFPITAYGSLKITQSAMDLARFPESAKIFLKGRKFPLTTASLFPTYQADILVQKNLANVLRRIAKNGPEEFYKGEIADLIVNDMEKNGGIITSADLKSYQPRIMKSLAIDYRGSQVVGTITHGGPTVLEMLKILNEFDLRKVGRKNHVLFHIFAEAMKYAFEDRLNNLWDPEVGNINLNYLLSNENSAKIKDKITENKALSNNLAQTELQDGHTTHLSVIDKNYNVVSLSQTLLSSFGSKVTIKNTGIVMNNGMQWFNPLPGTLSSVAPNKIPMSAISPMIVDNGRETYVSLGSVGYRRIIGALGQIIPYIVDFDLDLQRALDEPRIDYSTQYLVIDGRLPASVVKKLIMMGYSKVEVLIDDIATSNFSQPTGAMIDSRGIMSGGIHILNPDNVADGY